ncbi:MAG: DUF423 domain-containing protein [Xanthomonadales bacterium]|nr:DUF423 domain-containing protein [Xanthomonadales bacterium]
MAGLLGLSAVGLAAAGSHVVAGPDAGQAARVWQAANGMHLLHAAALLALAPSLVARAPLFLRLAGWAWTAGVLLFSGSLYLRVVLDLPSLRAVAPLGGLLLMAGWLSVVLAAAGKRTP